MELRYCESCGDILELEGAGAPVPLGGFVCASCGGDGSTDEVPAEETAPAGDNPMESFLDASQASLFSESSIAAGSGGNPDGICQGTALAEGVPPVETGLCGGPGLPQRKSIDADAAGAELTLPLEEEEDSSCDAGLRGNGGARAEEVDIPFFDEVDDGKAVGSQLPASRAQKIMFRCPHCKSALSIRPVNSTSRLECPACEQAVYVTAAGRILDTPPSIARRKRQHPRTAGDSSSQSASGAERQGKPTDPDASTKKMLSAGLMKSNPLDPDTGKRSEISSSTKEKLAAFHRQARNADPSKTILITEEKATSSVSDVKIDSQVVNDGAPGQSQTQNQRRDTAVAVNDTGSGDVEVSSEILPGVGEVAPDGESLLRKAASSCPVGSSPSAGGAPTAVM